MSFVLVYLKMEYTTILYFSRGDRCAVYKVATLYVSEILTVYLIIQTFDIFHSIFNPFV